ncbi:hypothetical protein [Aquicoccus sp.]|uniref:hypothetical protein n=1 Tax=Aquicoccus sp. TaxID=2055851 RepID=UPI003567C99A
MKEFLAALIMAASLAGSKSNAQDWAYLGGSPQGEVDVDSVTRSGSLARVHVRFFADRQQARMYMHQILSVDCSNPAARITDGWISSSYSSRVAPMPDLPEYQRKIPIPSPNEAYNTLFNYLCGR